MSVCKSTTLHLLQHCKVHCDLDPANCPQSNRDHVHSTVNVCTKFKKPGSNLYIVIIHIRSNQDRQTNKMTCAKQYTPTSLKEVGGWGGGHKA